MSSSDIATTPLHIGDSQGIQRREGLPHQFPLHSPSREMEHAARIVEYEAGGAIVVDARKLSIVVDSDLPKRTRARGTVSAEPHSPKVLPPVQTSYIIQVSYTAAL